MNKITNPMRSNEAYDISLGKIEISNQELSRFVYPEEIILCEADDTYTRVYLDSGEAIYVSKPLKRFEEMLSGSACFFRSHQSCLVNLYHIKGFNKQDGYRIVLSNQLEARIARRNIEALRKRL